MSLPSSIQIEIVVILPVHNGTPNYEQYEKNYKSAVEMYFKTIREHDNRVDSGTVLFKTHIVTVHWS